MSGPPQSVSPRQVGGLVLRQLSGQAEYDACVALQRQTWGANFQEVVPPTLLWVGQRIGGVAAGAFEGDLLVGFVFGLTGVEDGRLVHWSDMLAVRPEARGRGVGRLLKEYQRELLLPLGVDVVYWTFDPLEARNAHLNFARLGAIARRYLRDVYGEGTSMLHRGLGTDRLLAEWWIERRGEASNEPVEPAPPLLVAVEAGGQPSAVRLGETRERVAIGVPADIQALKQREPELARRWRFATREAFEAYLGAGYVVRGFERGVDAGAYILERRDEARS